VSRADVAGVAELAFFFSLLLLGFEGFVPFASPSLASVKLRLFDTIVALIAVLCLAMSRSRTQSRLSADCRTIHRRK